MKAYKFRSSSQFKFALDIIIKRRLFCSTWTNLNDPMEGIYFYNKSDQDTYAQTIAKKISQKKSRYRICSLSDNFQSHVLWSHYAGGFDGVAIEVELPEQNPDIKKITYRKSSTFLNFDQKINEEKAARKILFSKHQDWRYEKEIRILNHTDYYNLGRPVRRVIAGHRMCDSHLDKMYCVCRCEGIDFRIVRIGDRHVDAVLFSDIDCNRPRSSGT